MIHVVPRRFCVILALLLATHLAQASLDFTPWRPLFKGIEHSRGTNTPPTTITINGVTITDNTLQVANCLKIDLSDPDVRLFTTPRAPGWIAESRETLSLSVSNFIRNYKVQVAADANFYAPSDPTAEGISCEVHGFLVCTGQVVSPVDSQNRYASLLFTSNNVPSFNLNNRPPGGSTANIYTAITGFYPLLTNGMNLWALYPSDMNAQYPDSTIHSTQPRTAFGLSQDKRYLFIMTIDGRQGGYSDGALDPETAMWLLQFGVWDAINMDGGGSTVLYSSDCAGEPLGLNHSSLLAARNAERLIGCHFGVYAKPLQTFVGNVVVTPGDSTATITFQTPLPAPLQVDYGLTPGYGLTVSDSRMLTNHVVTLNGLNAATTYYFQITSSAFSSTYTYPCRFATVNPGNSAPKTVLFDVSKSWKWYSNSLDGVNWQVPGYNDATWYGPGPGLLYIDSSTSLITPKGTQIAGYNASGPTPVSPTHYFRTHFSFPASPSGVVLTFSNYIDDAAVFYLNGVEVQRIRVSLPPTNITYSSITDPPALTHCGSGNDATCPDVFSIQGSVANLATGDNVIAVEVHQATVGNTDMAFGASLSYSVAGVQAPKLNIQIEGGATTIYWNGSGFTLQYATDPGGPWSDVPGPVTASTYQLDSPSDTKFYRLRN